MADNPGTAPVRPEDDSAPASDLGRSPDLDRALTFVDAAIAIALTLLVLPLVDLAKEIKSPDDSVAELLRRNVGSLYTFTLSFVVIAVMWRSQHAVLRPVIRLTRPLLTLLFGWTLTIVFLPFPTALLARAGGQVATRALYPATIAVSMIFVLAINVLVHRRPHMLNPTIHGESVASTAISAVVGVVVVLLTAFTPINYWAFLLFMLVGRAEDVLRRRRGLPKASIDR